jgi:hypothetical protein
MRLLLLQLLSNLPPLLLQLGLLQLLQLLWLVLLHHKGQQLHYLLLLLNVVLLLLSHQVKLLLPLQRHRSLYL